MIKNIVNDDNHKTEKMLRAIAEMDEIGPSDDELACLIQNEKFEKEQELFADDLDLVSAAQSNPNYGKFMKFVLDKDKK